MTRTKVAAIPAPTFADWFVPPLVVPALFVIMIFVLGQMSP